MVNLISSNIDEVKRLFKSHKIEKAYVFGSAVSDNFTEKSDLDFLVKFEDNVAPLEKGVLWWDLHDTLRDLFNREIDIITEGSLKNPYFIKEIEDTKELIYG
jgi:predicted nucleotidyltransferase